MNIESFDFIQYLAAKKTVDDRVLLPFIFSALKQQGFFYFSINFDGETILLPHIDEDFDNQVIKDYHRVMDNQDSRRKFYFRYKSRAQSVFLHS